MAMAPLIVALVALLASTAVEAQTATDKAVLNFALNLEYLEANFYSCIAYGKPIGSSLWGMKGVAPTGCRKGKLSNRAFQYAIEVAQDEIAHVRLLRAVLGADAVDQPAMDLGASFIAAANAAASLALGSSVTLDPPFDPSANDLFFYHGSFIFEDVGATAYSGAAHLLETPAILTAAAQILSVESYHAGAVRLLLAQKAEEVAFKQPRLKTRQVVDAISALRDAVDGADDDDQGVTKSIKHGYTYNVVPADSNGLIYTRNTSQVLRIVYLGGASSGGFFPNGLNGAITTA